MEKHNTPKSAVRGKAWLVVSAVLCVSISACHGLQPDWAAAVTLTPGWVWLAVGLAVAAAGFLANRRRWSGVVLVLWGVYVVAFVPETRSLARLGGGTKAVEQDRAVRVVSLNCCVGSARAAAEVAQYEPDIVLLQESPGRESLEELSHDLFGSEGTFLYGPDTSILARGSMESRNVDRLSHFNHAVVRLPNGLEVDVFCVRLNPPVFRLDFWRPGFWIDHRDNRVLHREQLEEVMEIVQRLSATRPVIVGGDFNSPANDGAFSPLRPRLFDTFQEAGRGWGNTGTNGAPLFRVDQVWASRQFTAESVVARKTAHSDHRLVVCDLVVAQ